MDGEFGRLPSKGLQRVRHNRWMLSYQGSPDSKESACNAGDPGLIPESGGSSGEGNGYPRQYSCLENYMDRGVWQATVCGVTESDMTYD